MDLQAQLQLNPVADEVSAIVAVVRPILVGLTLGLKQEAVAEVGGPESVKLFMLDRLRIPGDGDLGICFEYAVHDAMQRGEPMVQERVAHALTKLCGVSGRDLGSILFAAEKAGSEQLIDTARELVTPESRLMSGTRGQPAKLEKHIEGIAQAFRRPSARAALPWSISGLWKADLFLGMTDSDRWVGTTVKSNPKHLEWARGLRIGIVPANYADSDAPYRDSKRKNLVICPLPYDGDFMEVFYEAWHMVQGFLVAHARVPPPKVMPLRPPLRYVAKMLEERRQQPVLEAVESLGSFSQPELLATEQETAEVVYTREADTVEMETVITPEPKQIN